MTTHHRIVIVGNGIAGVTAADTLRADGYDGELTLVGDERHAAVTAQAVLAAFAENIGKLRELLTGAVARIGDPPAGDACRSALDDAVI